MSDRTRVARRASERVAAREVAAALEDLAHGDTVSRAVAGSDRGVAGELAAALPAALDDTVVSASGREPAPMEVTRTPDALPPGSYVGRLRILRTRM